MALSGTTTLCLRSPRLPFCNTNDILRQSTVTTAFPNLFLAKSRRHSYPVASLAVAPTDVCVFVHELFLGDVFVDAWSPNNVDSQSIASQLFAASLFPYIGFLYHLTRSKTAPKLTLFGFYFLLAFVGATIPAGIYAKVNYGTSLANVDWLHGSAEFLLTLTNLFIVLGLRGALRSENKQKGPSE